MSVLGLIVEYNPFHNGHLYHFNTSMEITQAEYSVCVMSGNFVQRGEPAIVDKWHRARMALTAGIDLCLEIPSIYCVQSAEYFAYGAVSLLNSLGVVDTLCFGSECGNSEILQKIGRILGDEPRELKDRIKLHAKEGSSFASSRSEALIEYLSKDSSETIDEHALHNLLLSSNNILGLEYIKWLTRLNSHIRPVTISRIQSRYNDEMLDKPASSATAIRKALINMSPKEISEYMPSYSAGILEEAFAAGMGPVYMEDFTQPVLCALRSISTDELSGIIDVNEGLEYKIKKAAAMSGSINELIDNIKSKRYTETRIKRILVHTLLRMQKKELYLFKAAGGPLYIRVLGFSEKGKKLLSMIKKTCNLPIITNVGDYKKYGSEPLNRMIEHDILSSDIYVTSFNNHILRKGGYDFYKKPIIFT